MKKRKLLPVLLALAMVLTMIPASAFAGTTDNDTIYLNTNTGDDKNDGTSEHPVKTIARALEIAKADDTIEVTGTLNEISEIDMPVTVKGSGSEPVSVTGNVVLPKATGAVTFENFSFDGDSTIGAYYNTTDYAGLELVIKNCDFTKAAGNCVYIIPQIKSLTIDSCDFEYPAGTKQYSKQYLVWPYAAETVTIKNSTFDGGDVTRAAVHLGEGHPNGTTAVIEGNTIENFERGIQIAFTNKGTNKVIINENAFKDIALSENGDLSEEYEVATVFIHENTGKDGCKTTVDYTDNNLTGESQRMFYSENKVLAAEDLVKAFSGNKIGETAVKNISDSSFDPWDVAIGDQKFKSLDEAMEAVKTMTGDVVITVNRDIDVESASYDLSEAERLTSLTVTGKNKDVSLISGIDGNDIDGPERCPVINVTLPDGADFIVDGLTFPDDLLFDSAGGSMIVRNCTFNGGQSGYPKATTISYENNVFEFKGTAENFYKNNAYPVWYKLDQSTDFSFTGNTVIGYRGVHIETRGDDSVIADIAVDNNRFELTDDEYENKIVALQLVNNIRGKVSFDNNYVDAYMAVCFFNGVKIGEKAEISIKNNYLADETKLYGTSEWNTNNPEGEIDRIIQAFDDRITVAEKHEHIFENGVCTVCGEKEPAVPSGEGNNIKPDSSAQTGDDFNMAIPFAVAGLAIAALAAVIATRKRHN